MNGSLRPLFIVIRFTHPSQRGGIVGVADVVDCVSRSASPWFFGKWGLVLRNPRPLPFIPYSGQLGRFEVPDAILPPEALAA